MRIVVAPDKFAGSLAAPEVTRAIAAGWRKAAPQDEIVAVPMADGGPGFVGCLAASLPGRIRTVGVSGPLGQAVAADVFVSDATWYVEAAAANGRHLSGAQRDPMVATSAGVGEILRAACGRGATRIVVGLGGSATNDGGAGMLAALGAQGRDAGGALVDLTGGPAALERLATLDLTAAREVVAGVELVAATDVDSPLLGERGATRMFGAQKGLTGEMADRAEAAIAHWADVCESTGAAAGLRREPGAGAAGGLGYALLLLGASRTSGAAVIAAATDLPDRCASADLVITGEGCFDEQSRHGKVVMSVLAAAGEVPVVIVAGQSLVPAAQWRSEGFADVVSLLDRAGSVTESMNRAPRLLADAAADLARRARPTG